MLEVKDHSVIFSRELFYALKLLHTVVGQVTSQPSRISFTGTHVNFSIKLFNFFKTFK